MKHKIRILFISAIIVLLSVSFFVLFNAASPEDSLDANNDNKITRSESDVIEDYYLGKTSVPDAPALLWWQDMCRWTGNETPPQFGTVGEVNNKWINADAATTSVGYSDEGRGPAFRARCELIDGFNYIRNKYNAATDTYDVVATGALISSKQAFDEAGIKKQAWLEAIGDARLFVMAVEKKDGSYVIDTRTGSPNIIGTWWVWSWESAGYKPAPWNLAEEAVREPVWAGIHSFVNDEAWQGKYAFTPYNVWLSNLQSMGIARPVISPTYPDGSSALGTVGSASYNPRTPHLSKLYDANGSKNFNGLAWVPSWSESAENNWGELNVNAADRTKNYYNLIEVSNVWTPNGNKTLHYGDIGVGKDAASPFWRSYNYNAIWDSLRNGADGFWFDNYIGWDYISSNPINKAFGDWNVYTFQQKVNSGEAIWNTVKTAMGSYTNIIDYMKDVFGDGWSNLGAARWSNTIWLDDPVWNAFKAHCSDVSQQTQHDRYNDVKEIAGYLSALDPVADADKFAALGKTGESYICKPPEEIAVTGNDFCYLHFAAIDGHSLDIVSTETNDGWNVVTGNTYDAMIPRGRKSGTFALLPESTVTRRASIWYYTEPQYLKNEILGYIGAYQALANNITLNSGESLANVIGTNNSSNIVNKDIGTLKPYFGDRQRACDVGVLYSSNSEMAMLSPGGFVNGEGENCDTAYGGWCYSLDDLGVPYKCIQEWQLNEAGSNLYDIVKILILPNTTSMSAATVNNVLKPFLDAGGSILFSGVQGNIGKYSDKTELYKIFTGTSPLLQLYNDYLASGKVKHITVDPAYTYYKGHKNDDKATMDSKLAAVKSFFNSALNTSDVRQVERIGFANTAHVTAPSVVAYTNFNEYENRYFIDLVNYNVNDAITAVTPTAAGASVIVDLPDSFSAVTSVKALTNGTNAVVDISMSNFTYNAVTHKLTISNLPSFVYYYCIIVNGD